MQILTVLNIFSRVLGVFGLLMMLPIGVGLWLDSPLMPFLKALAATLIIAFVLWITTLRFVRELRPRDGLLLAALAWLLLPIFGALPLMYQIDGLSFTRAYFEASSGLTSTGASALTDLDKMPHAINYWRGQ